MELKIKVCTKCFKDKPLSEFYKVSGGKYNVCSRCKECMKSYARKYKQEHPIKINGYRRKYRKTLKGCLRERFSQMEKRCNNSNHPAYKNYGGRGIKCLFKNANEFINYVINRLKIDPRELQIDRINNDGNYEPGNIRFVTRVENLKNRRK